MLLTSIYISVYSRNEFTPDSDYQEMHKKHLTGFLNGGLKMARIPEGEVERLKKAISVQRLAEARGIKLTRHGAGLGGKCPLPERPKPAPVISPAKKSVALSRRVQRGRHGDRLG